MKVLLLILVVWLNLWNVLGVIPLPPGKAGPPLPEKGYNIENLGKGLYVVSDWAYQFPVVLTSRNRFIMADPPPSFLSFDTNGKITRNKVVDAMREISATAKIQHLIYSHSHADHSGAMKAMLESEIVSPRVRVWASEQIAKRLNERQDPLRPLPTDVVVKNYTLTVDDATIILTVVPYHEPGAFKITFPDQRAAYFCDLVFQGWAPFKQFGYSYDLQSYAVAVDDYLSGGIDIMICGHFTRTSPIEEAKLHRDYIASLLTVALKYYNKQGEALGAAISNTNFFSPSSPIYQNVYALIFPPFDQLDKNCSEEVLELWGDKMAGLEFVAESHCSLVIEALRVDITPRFVTRYAAGENMYDEVVNSLTALSVNARYHDNTKENRRRRCRNQQRNNGK